MGAGETEQEMKPQEDSSSRIWRQKLVAKFGSSYMVADVCLVNSAKTYQAKISQVDRTSHGTLEC